jgi:hypothetical protein
MKQIVTTLLGCRGWHNLYWTYIGPHSAVGDSWG